MRGTVTVRGRQLPHESALERDFLILLEQDRNVLYVQSQPVRLDFRDEQGRKRRCTPDFLVIYDTVVNHRVYYEVRYWEDLREQWPVLRTNITRFLSWVSTLTKISLSVGVCRRTQPHKHEKAILKKAAELLARLEATQNKREGRALLAAAISVVYGIPLIKVLTLQQNQFIVGILETTLWPGIDAICLVRPLLPAFAVFALGKGLMVFPGRGSLQPLTVSAVRHHSLAAALARLPPVRPID